MYNKLHFLIALAIMAIAFTPTASADLVLTLQSGSATANGKYYLPNAMSYTGAVGDWSLSVATGVEGLNALTLTSLDISSAGTNPLTITLQTTDDDASGSLFYNIGGSLGSGMSLRYAILVNGNEILPLAVSTPGVAGSICCKAGTDHVLTEKIEISATQPGALANITANVTVPDGGVTLMLLGGAFVGLETLRRKSRA